MLSTLYRFGWLSFLLVFFVDCSRTSTSEIPKSLQKQCNATALMNDKIWVGNVMANYTLKLFGEQCIDHNPIDVTFWTDLQPGETIDLARESIKTTCVDNRRIDQLMSFAKIPLKTGKYKLSDFQNCGGKNSMWTVGQYSLLDRGHDGEYYLSGVTTYKKGQPFKISGPDDSWLEITQYNEETAHIEGRFEVRFRNRKNEEIRFTKGTFRTDIVVMQF